MPGFNIGNSSGFERNTVETLRSHRWSIDKLGPIDALKAMDGQNAWYAKTFVFPVISSRVEKVQGSSVDYKFAGQIEYSNATVSFYDVILNGSGSTTQKILDEWAAKVYGTSLNGVGFADEYKERSVFSLNDGFGVSRLNMILHNSWPSRIEHSQLSYTESDLSEITVELTFDWYTTRVGDFSLIPNNLDAALRNLPSIQ